MDEISEGLKAIAAGARFDNFSHDAVITAGSTETKEHLVEKDKSIFIPYLLISGSLVSSKVDILLDNTPLLDTNVLAPIQLDGQKLIVNKWVERRVKVVATNDDTTERILSYTFPFVEITTRKKDDLRKALGAAVEVR